MCLAARKLARIFPQVPQDPLSKPLPGVLNPGDPIPQSKILGPGQALFVGRGRLATDACHSSAGGVSEALASLGLTVAACPAADVWAVLGERSRTLPRSGDSWNTKESHRRAAEPPSPLAQTSLRPRPQGHEAR